MTESGDIFREVAQAAGDIVFKYDLKTKKFMQYSDRSEPYFDSSLLSEIHAVF